MATKRRPCKNKCIYGTLVGTAAPTVHTHYDYVTSALLVPLSSSSPLFSPFFYSLYAYHSITLSTASVVAPTQGETLPVLAHAISITAALMCAAPYASREKPCGDSLGDRLITAFHQSPFRLALLQVEPDRSPLFPFLSYLGFSGLSNLYCLFLSGDPPPPPCFLECCVDKLTQTPVIFTPGMQRAKERDRDYRIADRKRKCKRESGRR